MTVAIPPEITPPLVNINGCAAINIGNSKTIYARTTQISKNTPTLPLP